MTANIASKIAIVAMLSASATAVASGRPARSPCRHVAPQDLTTFVVISVAYGFVKRCKLPFDMNQALSRYASHRTAQGLSPSVEATLKACLRLLEAAYYRNEHKAPKRATCTPFDLEVYTRTKARLEAGDYPAK